MIYTSTFNLNLLNLKNVIITLFLGLSFENETLIKIPSGTVVVTLQFITNNLFHNKTKTLLKASCLEGRHVHELI